MREFLARHRNKIIAALGLILPLFLLYTHGRYPRRTTFIEQAMIAVTSPAQKAANSMLSGVSELWNGYVALVGVEAQNQQLREEMAQLKVDAELAVNLAVENVRLREELEFKRSRRDLKMISAHIIGKDLSPYGRVVRIAVDVGEDDFIEEGMPVVSAMGLVGRVTRVSGAHAEVLLIADSRSTVNVRVASKGVLGKVTGTNSPFAYTSRLSYLHPAAPLEVGDLLVTSGHDKMFPPGLVVGTIRSLDERQRDLEYELQVTPSVNYAALEEVQVIVGVVEGVALEAPPAEGSPTPGASPTTPRADTSPTTPRNR